MTKKMKIVTALSVVLSFVSTLLLEYYKVQIPNVSLDSVPPLKVALMVYLFFLLLNFLENKDEYIKNKIFYLNMLIPFLVAFFAFRGQEIIPQVYSNTIFSSVFVLAILADILNKKTLKEEIEDYKKRTN